MPRSGYTRMFREGIMSEFIFFDIGYTLVNEDAVWQIRFAEQAATPQAIANGWTADLFYDAVCDACRSCLPHYRTVAERFRLEPTVPYRAEYESLYPEVPALLQYLSGKYALGIIANQSTGLTKRLDAFGIRQYFSVIASSWEAGMMKPDVRFFRYALSLAGITPSEALMIGDRLDNDIAPAKSIGMHTIRIRQGFGRLQTPRSKYDIADYEIDSLAELYNIL